MLLFPALVRTTDPPGGDLADPGPKGCQDSVILGGVLTEGLPGVNSPLEVLQELSIIFWAGHCMVLYPTVVVTGD